MSSQEQPPAPALGTLNPVVEVDPVQAALILDKLLPNLPTPSLRSLASRLGVTCNGYRRGHEPLERLVPTVLRTVKRDGVAASSALRHCVQETAQVGRLVREAKVKDLPHIIPDILREYSPVWLWFWLGADSRRGAKVLAEKVLEEKVADRQAPARRVEQGKTSKGSRGRQQEAPREAPPRAAATPELWRELRQEVAARRRAEARWARSQSRSTPLGGGR